MKIINFDSENKIVFVERIGDNDWIVYHIGKEQDVLEFRLLTNRYCYGIVYVDTICSMND